mgnify:FL=1
MTDRGQVIVALFLKESHGRNMTIFSDSDYLKIRERLEDTNVFSILGLENYEIRHSNFLAWVLNPHETHNLGSNICKNLIN